MDGKRLRDQFDQSGNFAKRARVNEEQSPSKVLHVRSLPPDTSEGELGQLCMPFGRVIGILLLSGKGQAFVQMEDVAQAVALVQYYSSVHAIIRGSVVFFQFSNRTEITSNTHSAEKQNRILLVSVSNLMYPITIDVLQRVFKKYGVILKIVTFSKGAILQALIEFDQVLSAAHAKTDLEGQNIYAGCCTLSIQFSNLESLTVKYNNERSRDFTNPHLPAGDSGSQSELGGYPFGAPFGNPSAGVQQGLQLASSPLGFPAQSGLPGGQFGQLGQFGQIGAALSANGPTVLIVSGLDETRVNPDILFTLFGVYGDVLRVKIMYNRKDTALVQFSTHSGAELAFQNLNGVYLFGKQMKVNFSKHQQVAPPKDPASESESLTKDYTGHPLHRFKNPKNLSHVIPPIDMLHIHNLPLDITEEQIQNLFRQYGTVVAFKFFESNRKMALIQMGSVEEAIHALVFLHGYPIVEGSSIRVSFSKSKIKKDE